MRVKTLSLFSVIFGKRRSIVHYLKGRNRHTDVENGQWGRGGQERAESGIDIYTLPLSGEREAAVWHRGLSSVLRWPRGGDGAEGSRGRGHMCTYS